MNIQNILDEVQLSLAPFRQAKMDAEARQAKVEELKQRSLANVFKGSAVATDARQRLEDHEATMKAKKAARIKQRAKQIATGNPIQSEVLEFDTEGKRLLDEAEESDAVLAELRKLDDWNSNQLQQAEAAVAQAETGIYQAYLEGIATKMIEHDSIMRSLHKELSEMMPTEVHRPRTMAKPSPLVEKALALVVIDQIHVPVNLLRGGATAVNPWEMRKKALMNSKSGEVKC
ncbi:MAG TPA: hypothetical protein VGI90_14470 [Steroidobacteraceae bacterium]|jgi:hypothetical protein